MQGACSCKDAASLGTHESERESQVVVGVSERRQGPKLLGQREGMIPRDEVSGPSPLPKTKLLRSSQEMMVSRRKYYIAPLG
mgnify:CR=1 FL=1